MTDISEFLTPDANSPQAVEQFVAKVGAKVKELRLQKAISRRALSELSGVSQRYLAQLESGSGNISVALLFKVANALGRDPDWFLNFSGNDDEAHEMLELLRNSSPALRKKIRRMLDNVSSGEGKAGRFCLIGLRGAGKSTLGKHVAKKLSYEFIELNDAIARQAGIPVSEIMALYGQEGYRQLERQALEAIVESRKKVILAVSGGIVSEPDTFNRLLSSFHSVWLKASPEEHMQRVRDQGDSRPMAGNPRAMEELKLILTSREMLYSRADRMVDTTGKSFAETKQELISLLGEMLEESA